MFAKNVQSWKIPSYTLTFQCYVQRRLDLLVVMRFFRGVYSKSTNVLFQLPPETAYAGTGSIYFVPQQSVDWTALSYTGCYQCIAVSDVLVSHGR